MMSEKKTCPESPASPTPEVEEQKKAPPKRRWRLSNHFQAFLLLVFALSIFMEVHYLNLRHWKRWDLTKNKRYSLSDRTKKFIGSLKDPVHFVLLAPKDQSLYQTLRDLIEEYQVTQPKITVEFVDVIRNPAKIEFLKKIYKRLKRNTALIVRLNQREKYLSQFDLQHQNAYFKGEEAITSALISLNREKKPHLYFTQGHGEPSLSGRGKADLSSAVSLLETNDYRVRQILLQEKDLPKDCDLLCVVYPQNRFSSEEEQKILAYLRRGGKLLALLEPAYNPGLQKIWKRYGLVFPRALVVEPQRNRWKDPRFVLVNDFSRHPFVEPLRGFGTTHPMVRPIEFRKSILQKGADIQQTVLARTSKDSFLILSQGQGKRGAVQSYAVGVLVDRKETGSKKTGHLRSSLLVWGDSHFALNGDSRGQVPLWGLYDGKNQDLFLNLVNGLTGQTNLLGLPKRAVISRRMDLSTRDLRKIWWFTLIFLPAFSLFLGFSVWFLRKS